jgi:serine/threonine protein phosphatase PrpC
VIRTVASIKTDVGRSRDHNEDAVAVHIPDDPEVLEHKGALYLVADGMGGHQAGEVASQKASEVVIREYYADANTDIAESLSRAARKANAAVFQMAQENVQRKGMGTTVVAAVVRGPEVHIANVGDSRAYLLRGQDIIQVTKDHSFVQEQIDAGIVSREEARNHPQRNVITRALGHRAQIEVDTFRGELLPGDVLLLCSDGLSGPVHDDELADILHDTSPEIAVPHLIQRANELGGPDNVSAVVVKALPPASDRPRATLVPPAPVERTADAGPPTGVEPPPKPPTPSTPAGPIITSDRRRWLLAGIGGLALLLLVALVALFVWWRRIGSEGTPAATPSPTVTAAATQAGASPSPVLDTPVPDEDPTATPALQPSSTPQPTSTLAPTPESVEPTTFSGCAPKVGELASPNEAASKYAGQPDVLFTWEGGQLCGDQVWQVTIDGQSQFCPPTTGQQVSCTMPSNEGEHQWRLEIWRGGHPVRGRMSPPRSLWINPPPEPPSQPSEPTPTQTPSERPNPGGPPEPPGGGEDDG